MHSSLVLAFIGDSVFELKIREYYVGKGIAKVNDLQKKTSRFASAAGHYEIMSYLLENELLNEEELEVFKKGRNAKVNIKRKNFNSRNYHYSTGFEAMIGQLYFENKSDRIDQLIKIIVERFDS